MLKQILESTKNESLSSEDMFEIVVNSLNGEYGNKASEIVGQMIMDYCSNDERYIPDDTPDDYMEELYEGEIEEIYKAIKKFVKPLRYFII